MEPIKPTLHKDRHYRYIQLQNEIAVLLISDATAKTAAAALDIAVGAFNDPVDVQGLAHFLEHMLFMGSAKYPNENAYDQFLHEHGGWSNAYTSAEHTVYHFEIEAPFLEKALDIFGSIFKAPLMDPSSTEREMKSVHSEDKKSEKMDSWRLDQVIYETADPTHPRAKFLGGNLTSLDVEPRKKGINVREQLLKFHEEHYSSNLMKCVIGGPQSLEELEKLARDALEGIVNKKIPVPHFSSEPWKRGVHLGKEVFFESLKTWRKLEMRWAIPSFDEHYEEATLAYLYHLLGHEGTGSLYAHLKARGWAISLLATNDGSNRDFDIFSVEVELSVDGWENHREDVVALTYEYIEMLKSLGPKQSVWEELKVINNIDFDNMSAKAIGSAVVDFVDDMWQYKPMDILKGPYVMEKFNPEAITKTLELLTPDNMLLVHCAKSFTEVTLDKTEKWYGVHYHVRPIDATRMAKWTTFTEPTKLFALPNPNPFIPKEMHIYPTPTIESFSKDTEISATEQLSARQIEAKTKRAAKRKSLLETFTTTLDPSMLVEPELIVDTITCKAYHLQDPMFPNNPKMSCRILIHCPSTYSTCLSYVLTCHLCDLVKDDLNEYTYDATQAGIEFSLAPAFEGFLVKVFGFAEKIPLLIQTLLKRIVDLNIRRERFDVEKQEALRFYSNYAKSQPYGQAQDLLDSITCVPRFTQEEKFYACAESSFEDLQYHHKLFFRQAKLEILMHGNITRANALELAQNAQDVFARSHAVYPAQFIVQRCIALPEKTDVRLVTKGQDPENANSAVFVWYQMCSFNDLHKFAMLQIATQLIAENLYNVLRTKEQLGYIVTSSARTQSSSTGFRVTVQSSEYTAAYLLSRVDNFMHNLVPTYLDGLSDDEFQAQITAQLSLAIERPSSIKVRGSNFWDAIEDGSYNFFRKLEEAQILKTLKKEEVVAFFKAALVEHRRASVLIQAQVPPETTHDLVPEKNGTHSVRVLELQDHIAFRNAMPLYPAGIWDRWELPELIPERTPEMLNVSSLPQEEEEEDEEDDDEEDEEDDDEDDDDETKEEHEHGDHKDNNANGTHDDEEEEEEEEEEEDGGDH